MTADTSAGEPDAWTPAFAGQRPPFAPGHEQSLVHGARSNTRVGALATQITDELLTSSDCPAHLREPVFVPAIAAFARAEAVVRLLWAYLEDKSEHDITDALTEVSTGIETEEATGKGKITRKTAARRTASALDQLRRYETLAGNLRARLGLDPASAARIGRDYAARRYMDAGATPLDAAVKAIAAQRALAAPRDGDSE